MKREGVGGFLYRTFRKDIGRKAMALLCALILWLWLNDKLVISKPYFCKLQVITDEDRIHNANQDSFFIVLPEELMEMKTRFERDLKVTISGPTEQIPQNFLIGRKDIYKNIMNGELEIKTPVLFTKNQFPQLKDKDNLEEVRFDPPQIELDLAVRDVEQIVLTPDNIEEFKGLEEMRKKGWEIQEVTFNPSNINIEGPALEIQRIRGDNRLLKLESIKLDDTPSKLIDVHLGLSKAVRDKRISINDIDLQRVHVIVNLTEKQEEFVLEGVPVLVKFQGALPAEADRSQIELDSGLRDPEKVNVRFKGSDFEISKLKKIGPAVLMSKVTLFTNLDEEKESSSLVEYVRKKATSWHKINLHAEIFDFAQNLVEITPEPDKISIKLAKQQSSQ